MKEETVSFQVAKLAKEKGFKTHIAYFDKAYNSHGRMIPAIDIAKSPSLYQEEAYPATSQSLLQRWLREEHRIFLNSITGYELDTRFQVYYEKDGITYDDLFTDMFDKYEDALEEGLYQALKLVNI
jgi:hypothetical protein